MWLVRRHSTSPDAPRSLPGIVGRHFFSGRAESGLPLRIHERQLPHLPRTRPPALRGVDVSPVVLLVDRVEDQKMSLGYVREKFRIAVLTLATGDDPLRQRFADAWVTALARVQVDELPPEIRIEFSGMISKMTASQDAGAEGAIAGGEQELTDDDARQLAETIVSIYAELCRLHPEP
jgi:hypothetical protein